MDGEGVACVNLHTTKARCPIATTLDIDDRLLEETVKAWGFKTKKEAVNTALQELLNKKKRLGILELFGKIEYDPDYNYKEHRSRKKSVRKRRRS
jgi:Arc/MetJ family transcription regulator